MSTKTINFLPEIFKTPANRKFLNATVDQLVTEPNFKKLNGYIGRKFAPTYKPSDNYLPEPSAERSNYQFEPSIVSTDDKKNIHFFGSYTDLLRKIEYYGGDASNQSRLFTNESYSFTGLIDIDKLVNFNQYYWLPQGPDPVEVFTGFVDTDSSFTVTRDESTQSYKFSNSKNSENPDIVLARGGTYTFYVNQPGAKFWIQTDPGTTGFRKNQANINTRAVYGVDNNGAESGIVTFTVPQEDAQSFYTDMEYAATDVDFASTTPFSQISNQLLTKIIANGGIDGVTDITPGKKLIFINNDPLEESWREAGIYAFGNWGEDGTATDALPFVPSVTTRTIPYSAGRTIYGDARFGVWEISIIDSDGDQIVKLNQVASIPLHKRVFIKSGSQYAAKEFYRSDDRTLTEVPLLTAPLTELWYNDGTDQHYYGRIKIVTNPDNPLDVTDFLGKKYYTSPNGVEFTNGLKINFGRSVVQEEYRNNNYYVEGVGTAIRLVLVDNLITPEFHDDAGSVPFDLYGYDDGEFDKGLTGSPNPDYITINRASIDGNAWSRSNRWFHTEVIIATAKYNNTVVNLAPSMRAKRPIIEFDPELKLFNYGAIAHHNIDILDFTVTDAMNQVELSRIEFTDVAPQDGHDDVRSFYEYSGVNDGSRIIFARDLDDSVQNKIFRLDVIKITGVQQVNLVDQVNEVLLSNESVIPKSGTLVPLLELPGATQAELFNKDLRKIDYSKLPSQFMKVGMELVGVISDNVGLVVGASFWFDGNEWVLSQQKTAVNQAPLFDIFDNNFHSASDSNFYPTSSFIGNKIFSYKLGKGANDPILGFPLTYRNFSNIGDIVFQNNFDTEDFTTFSNKVKTTYQIGSMFAGKIKSHTEVSLCNLWEKNTEKTKQYQLITHTCDGKTSYFEIDILPKPIQRSPTLRVYVNNKILQPASYTIEMYGVRYTVKIDPALVKFGDKIDIFIDSDSVSSPGYYEVPPSLEFNALNTQFSDLSLGQMSSHLTTVAGNSLLIEGNVPGSSNLRDVYTRDIPGRVMQHSAPAAYSSVFLLNPETNFIDSITLAQNEYTKFKNRFLESYAMVIDAGVTDPVTGVDMIMKSLNAVKNSTMPWYYSDMVPYDENRSVITDIVLSEEISEYEIDGIFNDTVLSNKAVLVYVNGKQQVRGIDYIFSQTRPAVKFLKRLVYDDVIHIVTFNNTDGCYVPETPTKVGLYPSFTPEKFFDDTYTTPIMAIRGHDGSITPAFGDFRDELLLELELRIFNNLKVKYDHATFDINSVVPGKFRDTDFTKANFDNIVSRNFLRWLGNNKVDYITNQWYANGNPMSWTYNEQTDTVDGEKLPGYWRGIFYYFYDTDAPHQRPWECLGFGSKPTWWEDYYGPAPYTGGNMVMWGDLERGIIRDGERAGVDTNYARPGLTSIIPVTDSGELRAPSDFLVSNFDGSKTAQPFAIGDYGPVEAAWRKSSNYPYAVQQALALMRPGVYFGQLSSVHNYTKNANIGQFANTENNQRTTKFDLQINGKHVGNTITRNAGYLNWVVDYITSNGLDPDSVITPLVENLDVKLAYRMAGFSDKNFLRVIAEQNSPSSTNSSIIIPDENYSVYLYKSAPIDRLSYSAVIVTKTATGYAVSGYNIANPVFTIIPSEVSANNITITVFEASATIYSDYQRVKIDIPYGTEFKTKQQIVDFLISYGRYLQSQGFTFNEFNQELGEALDWPLSAKEFLTWSQQGWAEGNLVVLSPVRDKITVAYPNAVADQINNLPLGSKLLDTNFNLIPTSDFNVVREGQSFEIGSVAGNTIGFADVDMVQFEHVLVFDNKTVFNDVIYSPELGNRQFRLKLIGNKTAAWDGQLTPPGFVYFGADYKNWASGADYRKGDSVKYKNVIYTALEDISATTAFNFGQWIAATNQSTEPRLLPNFAYNATKFVNTYDVDSNVIDEQIQAHSTSLIGHQERRYLTDLGITSTSQSKFYQGYIRDKGTTDAITALTSATFGNLLGDVQVNEEWAFRVGEYGATGTDKSVEVRITDSKYNTAPITIEFVEPGGVTKSLIAKTESKFTLYKTPREFKPALFNNRSATTVYDQDLLTAGYVTLDDVDATLFDIRDIASLNALIDNIYVGFKIWVAKDLTSDWNVFKIAQGSVLTTVDYNLDATARFVTEGAHHLGVGDVFAVRGFSTYADGFYSVLAIEDASTVVATVTPAFEEYLISDPTIHGTGTMFTLYSLRVKELTDVVLKSPPRFDWRDNDMLWVDTAAYDTAGEGTWGVYKKSSEWKFRPSFGEFNAVAGANAGATVSTVNGDVVIVTAPNDTTASTIPMFVKKENGEYARSLTRLELTRYNTNGEIYNNNSQVGTAVAINSVSFITNTKNTFAEPLDIVSKLLHYDISDLSLIKIEPKYIEIPNETYGSSIAVSADNKWLYVASVDECVVRCYENVNGDFTYSTSIGAALDTQFGFAMSTNHDGSLLVVSSPHTSPSSVYYAGSVTVYKRDSSTPIPTFGIVDSIFAETPQPNEMFGQSVLFTSTGELLIGSPYQISETNHAGIVYRMVDLLGDGNFTIKQKITKPYPYALEYFGASLAEDPVTKSLIISSKGATNFGPSILDGEDFVLDGGSTTISDGIKNAGAVYVYDLLTGVSDSVYAFTQPLNGSDISMGDNFGASLAFANSCIFVGSPANDSTEIDMGGAAYFENKNKTLGWALTRSQNPTVDLESVDGILIYNKKTQEIINTLDFIDPVKGKVLGIAEQEITYKTSYDPAQYNVSNVPGTNVDQTFIWGDEKVGQVWWDLSRVRYIDYEQGDLDYRIKHWGELFPGSEIVVCEWVKSDMPPSQYTGAGVPLYQGNTAYTERMAVNDITGVIQSTYYFWVRNKDLVDEPTPRRTSVLRIADLIRNPKAEGIAYVEIIKDNVVSLINVIPTQETVLRINYSNTKNSTLSHNEYELVKEKSASAKIPEKIISKLIDSLAGADVKGNLVPDNRIPPAERYGISIRPKQTMIVYRQKALQVFGNYVNQVLHKRPVAIEFDISNLYLSEEPPSYSYVAIVDTVEERSYLNIVNYPVGSKILVKFDSEFDNQWAVYEVDALKKYSMVWAQRRLDETPPFEYSASVNTFSQLPNLTLQPGSFEVGSKILVITDYNFNGNSAIYEVVNPKNYNLVQTQSYSTTSYWEFDDWYETGFDFTVKPNFTADTYNDIAKIPNLSRGNIVFVKDDGQHKFAFYKVNADLTYTLVGLQDGTIQLSNALWAHSDSDIGFDNANFDDVRFDLNPIIEIRNIFNAVRNDLFIGEFDGEFNKLFFVLLNYILSEQRMVDWAFKTSFISVLHKLRKLEQFPSYIRDNQTFYEDYINEVKPYRTKIREYIAQYEVTTVADVVPTDFDLPAYFDVDLNVWRSPSGEHARDAGIIASEAKYADWRDNYTYSIAQVVVSAPGYGYSLPPEIQVVGGGGSGAELEAVIDFYTGALVKIIVNNPGQGYTSTPELRILGDGLDDYGNQTAKAYLMMRNDKIRSFDTVLKFDRISYADNADDPLLGNAANRVKEYYQPVPGMPPKDYSRLFNGGRYTGDQITGSEFTDTVPEATIIESFFTGPEPQDFIELGGSFFIDRHNSHAPEEFVPGLMHDTVDIQVFTLARNVDMSLDTSNVIGYRMFKPMKYVSQEVVTTLKEDLPIPTAGALPIEFKIQVISTAMLPNPAFTVDNAGNKIAVPHDDIIPVSVYIDNDEFLYYGVEDNNLILRDRAPTTKIYREGAAVYRIALTEDLLPADLVIHLSDVSTFADPSVTVNEQGQTVPVPYANVNPYTVFIRGEKFLYYGVDYANNTLTLRSRSAEIAGNGVTVVNTILHPAGTPVYKTAPDWQFKRISAAATTTLLEPLLPPDAWTVIFDMGPSIVVRALTQADAILFARNETGNTSALVSATSAPQRLAVADVSGFPTPNPSLTVPGVVYINGERIVYYGIDRDNNLLLNLRRGTEGTGVAWEHPVGSRVVDASDYQTIPGNTSVTQRTWLNDTTPNADGVIAIPPGDSRIVDGQGLYESNTVQAQFLKGGKSYLPYEPGDLSGYIDPNANNTRFDDDGFDQLGKPVHPFDIDPFDSYVEV